MGPTVFPKPTEYRPPPNSTVKKKDGEAAGIDAPSPSETEIYLQPLFGAHRPDHDAVLALAAEYGLDSYLVFIESLRRAGFTGDIVLSVSPLDVQKPEIRAYLQSDPHVVVYVPQQQCFNFEGEAVDSVKGGTRVCHLFELYGTRTGDGADLTPLPDVRPARTVSVTRYEIYYIMARHYDPHQWLLLVDARDTYFQRNPFASVPRGTDPSARSGLLYFFGENSDATRIGGSNMNRKWLSLAYGASVADALREKPIVCSGATMGEQVAVDAYLRAMVQESDETGTTIYGADQGFHNFLYYSGKLRNAAAIHGIVVFPQGTGLVNNLGAMRTKALSDWGNAKILAEIDDVDKPGEKSVEVLNWDGTPSAVVHQYDRHPVLTQHFYKQKRYYFKLAYQARQKQDAKES